MFVYLCSQHFSSVPPTSTHSHTSLTHTWTGRTHLCPSHLHSQPHLPHPYLDRRDAPLSLPPPLTATPPSPIPGLEGHTSTHSHTFHTHTWAGGTHLHSQPHLPHPYLGRRDTPPLTATPPTPIPGQDGHASTHSHTSLTHTWAGGTHLHSQPRLPHPYLGRMDTHPLTATPLSPIPGQEGHTSTHSHTSHTSAMEIFSSFTLAQ